MTDYASLVARLRKRLITVPKPGSKPFQPTGPITISVGGDDVHKPGDDAGLNSVFQIATHNWMPATSWKVQEHIYAGEPLAYEAAERIALRADAMRYRWLADRYFGADFRWGDPVDSIPVLVFKLDADCRVYGSCDMTVDAAMAAPPVVD